MHQMRVLHPGEGILAFYDGRAEGYRFAKEPNWVDRGALELGVASYALVSDGEALVYDTHVSVEHARSIWDTLERLGVRAFTVVLSHWHLDHVAGSAVFADSPIIANERTAEHLRHFKDEIEQGTLEGPPAIDPLILPSQVFSDRLRLKIGRLEVELVQCDIHSDDATVVWLPEPRILLCGDTMEDTITYVSEPESLETHLADLDRLAQLDPARILPNHGDPEVIARGGYAAGLIQATRQYIDVLLRARGEPRPREASLREVIAGPLDAGWIHYFAPYEAVHRSNLKRVLDAP
jgi:glyoxylase-like metal-dependent hydrolase (beta-lactamase superfamily II)